MGNNDHFNKKDIQTHLKHILLQEYIKNWSNVLASASFGTKMSQVHFVDGFAGKGIFDDGNIGSPKIASDYLFDTQRFLKQKYGSKFKFLIHTVEKDETYFKELNNLRRTAMYPKQIFNYHGKFEEYLNILLQKTHMSPALYFIDPFGYKGVNMKDIKKILGQRSHEVLINVMSYSLVRSSNINNNQEPLYKFFGINKLPTNLSNYLMNINENESFESLINMDELLKLEDKIIEFYILQLSKNVNDKLYTLSKRIYSTINPKVYFHLVFATKNRDGLIEMKKSMINFENLKIKFEAEYIEQNKLENISFQENIFEYQTKYDSCNYDRFIETFQDKFKNRHNITYGEVLDYFLQHTPLPFRDIQPTKSIYSYIQKLEKDNIIQTTNKAFANHKKADNMLITITNQQQMSLF